MVWRLSCIACDRGGNLHIQLQQESTGEMIRLDDPCQDVCLLRREDTDFFFSLVTRGVHDLSVHARRLAFFSISKGIMMIQELPLQKQKRKDSFGLMTDCIKETDWYGSNLFVTPDAKRSPLLRMSEWRAIQSIDSNLEP